MVRINNDNMKTLVPVWVQYEKKTEMSKLIIKLFLYRLLRFSLSFLFSLIHMFYFSHGSNYTFYLKKYTGLQLAVSESAKINI